MENNEDSYRVYNNSDPNFVVPAGSLKGNGPERARRDRQRSSDPNYFTDDKALVEELKKVKTKPKAGVKRKYTLRVERTSNAGGTGAAPAIASAEYKPKKKTVAEELEIRYRAECLVQNEFDNKFIAKTIALRPLDYTVNLPTNAFPCKSLLHAIEKSFQDAGPGAIIGLLKEHGYMRNFIGMLCQVYWEGDNHWFYGRILNYSPERRKYFVLYLDDSTAEWLSFEDDPLIIGHDWVTVQGWPALKYKVSEAARDAMRRKKGFTALYEYVEYVSNIDIREYAFISDSSTQLKPFLNGPKPTKISKKLASSFDIASAELANMQSAIDEVCHYARKVFFDAVDGPNLVRFQVWVGDYLGQVVQYSDGRGEHLVVFNDPEIDPMWMTCNEQTVILAEQPPGAEINEVGAVQDNVEACSMCHKDNKAEHLLKCCSCGIRSHSFCMPCEGTLKDPKTWLCWKCTLCEGCGFTSWDKPYCLWNLHWISFQTPDIPIGICGDCLYRYKHAKDFCPLCYKLYPPEEEFIHNNFPQLENGALNIPENGHAIAHHANGTEPPMDEQDGVVEHTAIDDESMVQCNECSRWVHSLCEGIDQAQYEAMTKGTHPVWGDEYLCPGCRIDIPRRVIEELGKEDDLGIFAEPVTRDVAENYFEVIRSPMDMLTMLQKANRGQYKSLQSLRQDLELMCHNALVFNKAGDEYFIAAMVFFDKVQGYFDRLPRQSHMTAFGNEATALYREYKESIKVHTGRQIEEQYKSAYEESRRRAEERVAERAARMSLRGDRKTGADERRDDDPGDDAAAVAMEMETHHQDRPSESLPVITSVPVAVGQGVVAVFLPQTLAQDPDPPCAFTCAAYTLHSEDAFYLSCSESCLVCGSSAPESALVFCIDCGEAFHSFCVDIPLKSIPEHLRLSWRCTHCKVCEVCCTASVEDEQTTLYCDLCDRAFHFKCIHPPLTSVPDTAWVCSDCIDCRGLDGRPCVSQGSSSSKPTWGCASNLCIGCQQSADSLSRASSRCVACDKPRGGTYISCRKCSSVTHRDCLPSSFDSYVKGAYENYLCIRCVDAFVSLPSRPNCHLGSNTDSVWDVLSKVTTIQRMETAVVRKLKLTTVDLCRALNDKTWTQNRILLVAIIRCALNRLVYLQHANLHDKVLLALSNPGIDTNASYRWIRERSMSFLKLLASEANRALVRSESSFATSNLSIVEIRNYAILAGAFIFHSEKELGGTDMDHQLENTAKSVMKELQTYFETDPTPAGFDTPSESSEPNSGAVATTTTEPSVPGAFQDFKLKLMIKTGDNNIPIEDSLREANHLVLVHSLKLMLQVLIIPPVEVKLPAADARVPSPANAPETTRGTEMVVMRTLQFNITDTKKATATKQAPFNSYKKKPEGLVPVNITDGQSYYGKLQRNFKEAVVDAVQRGLHKVSPLRGWKPDAMGSLPWIDPRSCLFCGGVENDVFYGRFVPCGDMLFAHVNCIRWSDEVIENCGVLCSAPVAVRRSRIANCYLCSQKGATVGCRIKGCKRTFHLKCGVAVGGRLIELKHANDDDGEEHLVFARYECPEHIHGGYRHQARGHYSSMTMAADGSLSLNNKRPSEMVCIERSSEGLYEPYRRLKTDDLQIPDSELVAHEVSLKNHAGRLGAMVVHSLGSICTQKPEGGIDLSHLFYNERQIFPHKFRSSRIFWSTRVALTRTLYVFEVLSEHDLQETAGYIANTGMSSQITSEKRPVFRVTIMNDGVDDNTHEVIHGASVEDVYADIISRVEACTLSALPHLNKRKVSRSFGLNAYQFFGLGVPFVRRAIEDLPFSIAAVVANAAPQYRPCYNLYSAADYVKFEQLSGEVMHHNSSGCARAQGLEVVLVDGKRVRRGARITKILAKTVDDPEADGAAATEAMDEEQSDENRRNIERSRLRYLELAAEYKLNPGSKLQVRRSSIHGWGLFAKTKFYKHDMIVEYIGQKVRAVVADKREVMYEDEGVGSCYLFRLDKDAIVDATRTGGMARFINHCCEPNAYARIISAGSNVSFEDDADKHIVIFANRDIEEDEEITYDYKFPIEDNKLRCLCNAPRCQGVMN